MMISWKDTVKTDGTKLALSRETPMEKSLPSSAIKIADDVLVQ